MTDVGTIISIFSLVKSLFKKKKKKDAVRRRIKSCVDKIEERYREQITTHKPEWMSKKDRIHHVNLLPSDIDDFKKLNDLFNGAENLLSKKEWDSIHELIDTFDKEKYHNDLINCESINPESTCKIADLAKTLQDLIKKKLGDK